MACCPRCTAADLFTVTLTPAGRTLRLQVCRGCEHRWWSESAPGDIVLDDVLVAVGGPSSVEAGSGGSAGSGAGMVLA